MWSRFFGGKLQSKQMNSRLDYNCNPASLYHSLYHAACGFHVNFILFHSSQICLAFNSTGWDIIKPTIKLQTAPIGKIDTFCQNRISSLLSEPQHHSGQDPTGHQNNKSNQKKKKKNSIPSSPIHPRQMEYQTRNKCLTSESHHKRCWNAEDWKTCIFQSSPQLQFASHYSYTNQNVSSAIWEVLIIIHAHIILSRG